MRINNSIRNIRIGIMSQLIITCLGFFSRKIFLDNLGIEYLGVNGVLTNVLSLLGLIEAGIGTSIVYNLYKPIAQNDKTKIIALVQLYKRAYTYIAIVVLLVSIVIYPLMINIMGEHSISYISIIYFLFVLKNVFAYLYAHKWCLINADQKNYILSKNNLYFNIISMIMKIVILQITKSYILFLFIELIMIIIQNSFNAQIVNKKYPYIITNKKYSLDEKTSKDINKNVRALFLHNLGSYCIFGTDNIIITKFVSIAVVGMYSNYTMIISQLGVIIGPILGGIGNSVGNLIVTEHEDKTYSVFNSVYLVNFWIYSICVIFLYNLIEPFITWIFGEGLLLDEVTFFIILINFYLTGMRNSIATFKNKAGIFIQDKYVPLVEAAINLISSIILVQYIGLVGVFLGTTISTLSIVFWNVPRLVYKNVFKKPLIIYFKKYALYTFLTFVVGIITTYACGIIQVNHTFTSLVLKGILCLLIPNLFYFTVFYKTQEFQYIYNILKPMCLQIKDNVIIKLMYN